MDSDNNMHCHHLDIVAHPLTSLVCCLEAEAHSGNVGHRPGVGNVVSKRRPRVSSHVADGDVAPWFSCE